MLYTVDGAKGSGKTFLMTKFLHDDFKAGNPIKANYKLLEIEYRHFYLLNELFGCHSHSIGIDEGQKIFHCRRPQALPLQFMEMIAGDRHDHNNIYVSTQNFWHIDKNVRDNTDVLFQVKRIFRFPINQNLPAIFQWSVYWKCDKRETPSGLIRWHKRKRKNLFITKWTKKLYNTYEKISLANYQWRLKMKAGKPTLKIVSRSLIEAGRKRL